MAQNSNHFISLEEGAKLTKKYRNTLMTLLGGIKGLSYDKEAIRAVIDQNDCVEVRIYLGLSDDLIPKPQLIIVGVDVNGNDITHGIIADRGAVCPPNCSDNNILNS